MILKNKQKDIPFNSQDALKSNKAEFSTLESSIKKWSTFIFGYCCLFLLWLHCQVIAMEALFSDFSRKTGFGGRISSLISCYKNCVYHTKFISLHSDFFFLPMSGIFQDTQLIPIANGRTKSYTCCVFSNAYKCLWKA